MQSYLINSQKRKLQAVIVAFIIITMLSQWFAPLVAHAESLTDRTIHFNVRSVLTFIKDTTVVSTYDNSASVKGVGHFVVKSFRFEDKTNDKFGGALYVYSDKPFTYGGDNADKYNCLTKNDIYYCVLGFQESTLSSFTYNYIGLINCTDYSSKSAYNTAIENSFNSLDLSKDDYKELVFDADTAQFSSDIPTPRITVDNNYNLSFNNATDNYYFQIKGRWYSVDDIELYKQSAQWKYKYNSIIKSGLTEWTEKAIKTNTSDLNLATLGKSAFDNFLSQNPIDSRSYTGGTNALGNYFSGYNDALSTIKMLLKQPTTLYNGLEIYVRYYEFDSNGVAHYGKWCHYYDNLANANGSSGSQWDDKDNMFMGNQSSSGLTDDQFNDVENTGNSTKADTDLVPDYNNSGSGSVIIGDADLTSITTTLKSLYSQGQEIINMFGQVFSFLPSWLTAFICTSIGLVCLIGIIKALRG